MPDDPLVAIASSAFTLSGVRLRCYVLSNGQRVVNADDAQTLFDAWGTGVQAPDEDEIEAVARWLKKEQV
jgi:hypothetical protein